MDKVYTAEGLMLHAGYLRRTLHDEVGAAMLEQAADECSRLRALVREMTDALATINTKMDFDPSIGFKWTIGDEEFESLHTGALVDKAREAIGGAE